MEKRSIQSEMSSYVGKQLRDHFGKGPSSVFVSIEGAFLTIYVKDFLAPMERVLVGQENDKKVEETRDLLMKELIPDIKASFRAIAGIHLDTLYYDWSLSNRTGVIIGLIEDGEREDGASASYKNQEKVHEEVARMSWKAEKTPLSIQSFLLNERTLLVERTGILVAIEKELINSGYEQPLKLSKRKLEKRLLHIPTLEKVLEKKVEDAFLDWDFNKDRSYLVLILKP
ncbi:DUF2294 domain-containing protein [Halobacillus karajensis]|uniref:Na+-translocating membrane potential-generating system MpsC domain-containing protein n=1 Tax=Halobacillus karajensis TaxID=195088 RepID=A0A024P552_9BACI|nr:Na-translocating system protein MpsC family protein [Halobacillus karajensis]CDQ18815.1 hypothetical protein BN982_01096 [Halobacillus karajensis]CDQ23112.1 hypothetical protein BN983_01331 [Halobacillus karajensis]CDQ26594.1 hypothetical protein BN981_00811 [Halobacillus karajensis]